jgi:hypothetical protein
MTIDKQRLDELIEFVAHIVASAGKHAQPFDVANLTALRELRDLREASDSLPPVTDQIVDQFSGVLTILDYDYDTMEHSWSDDAKALARLVRPPKQEPT